MIYCIYGLVLKAVDGSHCDWERGGHNVLGWNEGYYVVTNWNERVRQLRLS